MTETIKPRLVEMVNDCELVPTDNLELFSVVTDDGTDIDVRALRDIWCAGWPTTRLALLQLETQYNAIYPEVADVDVPLVGKIIDTVQMLLGFDLFLAGGDEEFRRMVNDGRPPCPPDDPCKDCRDRYAALTVALSVVTDDDGNVINPWDVPVDGDDDGGQQKSREVLA
jgi:hypothetical protein